jgi:hypothetical protein
MNDERLRQRIAYLVENGVVDDPLDEIRRQVRALFYMTSAACIMGVVGLLLLLR